MLLSDRKTQTSNVIARKLFSIMENKKTNLCASADLTTVDNLITFAEKVAPYICVLKTHIDILTDFDKSKFLKLLELAKKYDFLVFEDRKFADIGNTVHMQYTKGVYEISSWADIINAHALPGKSIIDGLKKNSKDKGLILLAEMSTKNNLFSEEYTKEVVKLGLENSDFVIGFICQNKICTHPGFIHFTPGVKFTNASDNLGQSYRSVSDVLLNNGSDIIIIGRDLYESNDQKKQARLYKELAWDLYVRKQQS